MVQTCWKVTYTNCDNVSGIGYVCSQHLEFVQSEQACGTGWLKDFEGTRTPQNSSLLSCTLVQLTTDQIPDGQCLACLNNPPLPDFDSDGIPDDTDPDDDNDSYSDIDEIAAGSNPKDPNSIPPPPPPPPSSCECKAEIERVYQRVDYVYTKADYALNELNVISSALDSLIANQSNGFLGSAQENQQILNAIASILNSVITKISEIPESLNAKFNPLSASLNLANQSISDLSSKSDSQSVSLAKLEADVAELKKNVRKLLPKKVIISDNLIGRVSNSGKYTLPSTAKKVFLTNALIPSGFGRRFSRVSDIPDKFKLGFLSFCIDSCYTVEMPIEYENMAFPVPLGATSVGYWLDLGVTIQLRFQTETETDELLDSE